MEKKILGLLSAVGDVAESESNEGCSDDLTVICYEPFQQLLQAAKEVRDDLDADGRKKHVLGLTAAEVWTIEAALKCALRFTDLYYTLAPAGDNYNDGDDKLQEIREKIARRILEEIGKTLPPDQPKKKA